MQMDAKKAKIDDGEIRKHVRISIYNDEVDKLKKILLTDDRAERFFILALECATYNAKLESVIMLLETFPNVPRFGICPPYKTTQVSRAIRVCRYLLGHGYWLERRRIFLSEYAWVMSICNNWTFTKKYWRYFPRRKRKVYMDFLVSLKRLGIAPYFRDLHDTILPYFMIEKIK